MSISNVKILAEELASSLSEDIAKCTTREEHIRVSARANVAVQLLMDINEITDEQTSDASTES